GDLTDPDQRLTATELAPALEFPRTDTPDPADGKDQVHQFKVGDIPDPAHQVTHQDVTVTCCRFSNGETRVTLAACVAGRRWQYSSSGPLLLGDRPATAPIIHLGGPLTWKLVKPSAIHQGEKTISLQAVLGTPGLGEEAFAPLGLQDLPAAMTVT